MKDNKKKKVLFSIFGVFLFAFSFLLINFNFSLTAKASVINNGSVVSVSNSSYYRDYTPLEYIRGNYNQWINTGYKANSNTSIEVDFVSHTTNNNYYTLFGSRSGSNSGPYDVFTYFSNFGNTGSQPLVSLANDLTWNFSLSNPYIRSKISLSRSSFSYVSSTTSVNIPFSNVPSFSSSLEFYIFGSNKYGTISDIGSYSIYSFKIYQSGSLVRDFYPSISKSNGKVGLYDSVNNVFYTSQTSTNFIAGPTIYNVNFYNGSTLYNTQSFTNFSDFILPSNPSVPTGYTFLGWSLTNDNNINSVISPSSFVNSSSNFPLNFYSVVISDEFLAGYNEAKNIYDGFGPFLYSNYSFVKGNSIDSFDVIPSLTGRVSYPDFIGYGGGVVLSDSLWNRVDEYEYNNEADTSLVFTFDTPVPVAKYTNFMFNGNFQFGNSAVFYFNDGTSYTFSSDMGLGNFVDLTSYNTKFITRIRLTYASSIGDYGQGIGLASNPSYLDSYNNGYNAGKDFGYNNGYSTGYREGNNKGYNNGYNAGLSAGSDYSFFGLFSALFDAPIATLTNLLNFDIFGVNLLSLFLGLLTLAVILLVLRLIRGGK